MAAKKVARRQHPPTREQVRVLVRALEAQDCGAENVAAVSAWTGLRLSEVCALQVRDVLRRDRLQVRAGKGDKPREVTVLAPARGLLVAAAVSAAVRGNAAPLFRNSQYRPWTKASMNKRWVKAREAAGLEQFWFHDLRKFHATYLLNAGVAPMDVAVQLGHIDRYGRPNIKLVVSTYAFVNHAAALDRISKTIGDIS